MAKTEQMTPEPLTRWVRAADFVADSWLADFYDPDFLALEHQIDEHRGDYVALGDLVSAVEPRPLYRIEERVAPPPSPSVRWHAALKEQDIVIQRASAHLKADKALPREAILISSLQWGINMELPILFWQEEIWGGKAAADPGLIILTALSQDSIAWISRELSQPYCQKQIQRLTNPTTVRLLRAPDLLRQIKRLAPDEQQFSNELVLRDIREERQNLRLSSLDGPPGEVTGLHLPGASYEERRRQFEEYIIPSFDAQLLAFVEASTTNRNSDLFAMRHIAAPVTHERLRVVFPDRQVTNDEKWWREWYWNGTANEYLVCHALTHESNPVLPAHLFERLLPSLISTSPQKARLLDRFKGWKRTHENQILLPSPGQLQEVVGLLMRTDPADITDLLAVDSLLPIFSDAAGSLELHTTDRIFDALELLKQVFRPVLMVRMVRDGCPVGVYFLAGGQQFDEPTAEKEHLERLGEHLLQFLQPRDDFVREATRKESLRRLSWFAHQINGPIGIADTALGEVLECLQQNPSAASLLAPDDAIAHRMAAMAGQPIETYQIKRRVDTAMQAIHALRRVNYQIRQLRRIQGNIALAPCKILPVINEQIQLARESLPNLRIREIELTDEEIEADAQLLKEAFQEVFNNSIRELKTRKTEEPMIDVTISHAQGWVRLSICDNGLPSLVHLIDQPFEEDSSTYAQQGRGSGLGLTVVREIIMRHNGTCSLTPNCDEDGERIPGVTFTCNLPLTTSLPDIPTL